MLEMVDAKMKVFWVGLMLGETNGVPKYGQYHVIVGVKSMEEAHRKLLARKLYEYSTSTFLRNYGSETGNEKDISRASDGSIWARPLDGDNYVKLA